LEQQDDWLFSFTHVCETPSFEPDYVRQGLQMEQNKRRQTQAKVFTLNPERPKSCAG
jgi:hypothetical protein